MRGHGAVDTLSGIGTHARSEGQAGRHGDPHPDAERVAGVACSND
jgi:hypothetical protein